MGLCLLFRWFLAPPSSGKVMLTVFNELDGHLELYMLRGTVTPLPRIQIFPWIIFDPQTNTNNGNFWVKASFSNKFTSQIKTTSVNFLNINWPVLITTVYYKTYDSHNCLAYTLPSILPIRCCYILLTNSRDAQVNSYFTNKAFHPLPFFRDGFYPLPILNTAIMKVSSTNRSNVSAITSHMAPSRTKLIIIYHLSNLAASKNSSSSP